MKILYHPVFVVSCVLFVLHQLIQNTVNYSVPLLDDYLDNLLAVPILLTLVVAERRLLFRRGADYRMDGLEVTLGTLVIALAGDLLFPALSDRFKFDYVDFAVYAAGGVVFYWTINRRGG